MSKRLQVVLDDADMRQLQRLARSRRTTVSEWVRQAIREATRRAPAGKREAKLQAVREAVKHGFPTGDIQDVLRDIERGYGGAPPP